MDTASKSFLFVSLQKLYLFAQLFGCASFSYSPQTGVFVTAINVFTLVFFTLFYWTMIYVNVFFELTIRAKGYQAVLFYVGFHLIPIYVIWNTWITSMFVFIAKKKIATLMEEVYIVYDKVSQ